MSLQYPSKSCDYYYYNSWITREIPNVFDFRNREGKTLKSTAEMAVIVIIMMQV